MKGTRRRGRCPQVTLLTQQSTGQGPRMLRELERGIQIPSLRTMEEGAGAARCAWARHGAGPWGGGIPFGESCTTPFLKQILVIPSFFPQRYDLKLE